MLPTPKSLLEKANKRTASLGGDVLFDMAKATGSPEFGGTLDAMPIHQEGTHTATGTTTITTTRDETEPYEH